MNKFIEKIGMDKVAHFGVGGLISALFTIVAMLQDLNIIALHPWRAMLFPFVGLSAVTVLAVMKEIIIDPRRDWKDFYASIIGAATMFVATFFGVLFYFASTGV